MFVNKKVFAPLLTGIFFILLIGYGGFSGYFPYQLKMPSLYLQNTTNSSNASLQIASIPGIKLLNDIEITKREDIYSERRADIRHGCSKTNRTLVNEFRPNIAIDSLHHIYYCPIPKVSSTFWKRVLTVMTSKGKLRTPYDISLGGVKLNKPKTMSEDYLNFLLENGTSFLFVRDPYARLFSGYENKIYHPNLMFWHSIGRQVINRVRGGTDSIYKNYGFNVTFQEFIKYIISKHEGNETINNHFAPMISICDPCSLQFDVIGKLETFTDDARYLLTEWRTRFEDVTLHFNDFEKERTLDTARGHVRFLFAARKILAEIKFPFIRLMLRTWRDLQIRGLLSKHVDFPFKESDVENVTDELYMTAITRALDIPINRTEVKLQRQEALVQAYRQISLDDMERVRLYVLEDCQLFGYDDRPQLLFDRSQPIDESFVYLDGLSPA